MSGFCGWLQLAPSRACEAEILLSMASALKRFDGAPVRTATVPGGGIAVVARTAEGSLHQDADTIVGVIGHARLTERALAELAATQGLAAAIARVFAADADRVTNVLSGSFALAIIDR